MGQMRYFVYFTPLINSDAGTYGDEVDVSDRILVSGVGTIRRSIDSSDYDIGVFTFSDLELQGLNHQGYFNEEDYRSIFPAGRDRAKVRIVFENLEMVRNAEGTVLSETVTDTVTFRGIINEEGTRVDLIKETIRFKVLSRDSVLRTSKISSGTITNGVSFKTALETILNVPRITSVLNFNAADINPKLNLNIDVGSWFNNKSVKEALDKLLFASNSVLIVNDAGDMIVKSREPNDDRPLLNLYGQNDIHKRENIIDIREYNTGKQRTFTSFVVNGFESANEAFVLAFGLRQKRVDLPFINTAANNRAVAEEMVDEFKTPKIELAATVSTDVAKEVQLLDLVSVNYPYRLKPPTGKFLPIIGITEIGDADMPLPEVYGSLEIPARLAFKVIEIEDSPQKFTSTLKLRQIGKNIGDGVFDTPNNCLVNFAVIGSAEICTGGDLCETWNPSSIGSAQIGCTIVAA